ncbi:hypothetical protein OIU79_016217 [Salix purpurea]|uniref:Uncharacterized protein n=1 Tax=Salix purpurea TaxID=77065 RepID=A0A9Q0PDP9_SALPP|nr:hypothetical protein OIU79_016217 [Salix purpurea]
MNTSIDEKRENTLRNPQTETREGIRKGIGFRKNFQITRARPQSKIGINYSHRNLAFQPWWNDFSCLKEDHWIELIVTTIEDSASSLSIEGQLPITFYLSKLLINTIIIDFLLHDSAFSPTSLAEIISAVSFYTRQRLSTTSSSLLATTKHTAIRFLKSLRGFGTVAVCVFIFTLLA